MQYLGGRVDVLAEAWEAQRKYGGLKRPKAADGDSETAPPFRHFVPGKDNRYAPKAVGRAASAKGPVAPSTPAGAATAAIYAASAAGGASAKPAEAAGPSRSAQVAVAPVMLVDAAAAKQQTAAQQKLLGKLQVSFMRLKFLLIQELRQYLGDATCSERELLSIFT